MARDGREGCGLGSGVYLTSGDSPVLETAAAELLLPPVLRLVLALASGRWCSRTVDRVEPGLGCMLMRTG